MTDDGTIAVEVAYASPEAQILVELRLHEASTVADAINAAVAECGRELPVAGSPVGIWGRVVDRSAALRDGDRVEIYRPLALDPREARRQYAAAGLTMATGPRRDEGGKPRGPDSASGR
jgi:putative ubiquitin-RnfH superfamily antitoxin RatB of RatAB toxin-antitoxin module